MKESDIQSDIMDALLVHKDVVWAMVITTGVFRVKGGYITTGHYMSDIQKRKTGISDIVGQLTNGKFFCIETKKGNEKPSDEQYDFMGLVAQYQGVSGWCNCVEDAIKIVEDRQ